MMVRKWAQTLDGMGSNNLIDRTWGRVSQTTDGTVERIFRLHDQPLVLNDSPGYSVPLRAYLKQCGRASAQRIRKKRIAGWISPKKRSLVTSFALQPASCHGFILCKVQDRYQDVKRMTYCHQHLELPLQEKAMKGRGSPPMHCYNAVIGQIFPVNLVRSVCGALGALQRGAEHFSEPYISGSGCAGKENPRRSVWNLTGQYARISYCRRRHRKLPPSGGSHHQCRFAQTHGGREDGGGARGASRQGGAVRNRVRNSRSKASALIGHEERPGSWYAQSGRCRGELQVCRSKH